MQQNSLYKKIMPFLYFAAQGALVIIYLIHSAEGIFEPKEYRQIVGVLGLGNSLTITLAYLPVIVDFIISLLLIAKNKILPKLSWSWVYAATILWPVVPRIMEWRGGLNPEWEDAGIVAAIAIFAFYANKKTAKQDTPAP